MVVNEKAKEKNNILNLHGSGIVQKMIGRITDRLFYGYEIYTDGLPDLFV